MRRAQDWLCRRFKDLSPDDFCDGGVIFFTAQLLEAPIGFENVWGGAISPRHRAGGVATREEQAVLCSSPAVILLGDLGDKEQMNRVINMGEFVNSNFGDAAPLLILVPHSACPEISRPGELEDLLVPLTHALDSGIDEAVSGEPEGLKFALEVQNRVFVQASLIEKFNDKSDQAEEPDDQEARVRRVQFIEDVMHDIVWDYLRVRLNTDVPAMDCNISPGIPNRLEDYRLGALLGKGNFGRVYKLESADDGSAPTGSVLKAIPKKNMLDMPALYNVKKQLDVMRILSEESPHPNVSKLQRIYHSETHLLLQLEDCGPSDLYKFYLECERRQRPLSAVKTQSIIDQLISAVCHMHTKSKVVHCDLKPENIIIRETQSTVVIKVSDFDTAQVNPQVPSYGIVGTFPFSAPEIILEREFDPYAADIWSLGLVLLELLCFSQVLETALQLDSGSKADTKRKKSEIRRQMMMKIRHFFSHEEAIGCLLQENMRNGLQDVMSQSFLLVLKGMLRVSGAQRIRADGLVQTK